MQSAPHKGRRIHVPLSGDPNPPVKPSHIHKGVRICNPQKEQDQELRLRSSSPSPIFHLPSPRSPKATIFQLRAAIHLLLISLLLLSAPLSAQVLITEFMASNRSAIADENGEYNDWIELHNAGAETINLSGYGLTDNPSRPYKWTFPSVSIQPGEFLLIWASGKDRKTTGAPLHTSYSISADGETLVLTMPNGTEADRIPALSLQTDQSFGRPANAPDQLVYFITSTPGAANTQPGYSEILPPPQLSHTSGFYSEPFQLVMNTTVNGAQILYTLDGTEPSISDLSGRTYTYKNQYPENPGDPEGDLLFATLRTHLYSQAVQIEPPNGNHLATRSSTATADTSAYVPLDEIRRGVVFRARTVKEGALSSTVVSRNYYFTHDGTNPYKLPIVALSLPEDALFDYENGIYNAGYYFDQWRKMNPDFHGESWNHVANYYRSGSHMEVPGHITFFAATEPVPAIDRNVGFRLHGGTTRSHPQKSIRFYTGTQYDERGTFNYPVFQNLRGYETTSPVNNFHRLLLRNSGNDSPYTRIRDAFAQEVLRPLGIDLQAYQPAIQFINGEFWGMINIRERIDRYYIQSHHAVPEDDVAIIEITASGEEIDEGTQQDVDDFLALREYMRTHDLSQPDHYNYVANKIDLENFLLYHMAQIFIKNTDWPGSNMRVWRHRNPPPNPLPSSWPSHDGRWRYIFCDLDFSFGPFYGESNDHNTLEQATAEGGTTWPNPDWSTIMLRTLLQNQNFRNRFIQSFCDHLATTFKPSRTDPIVDSLHNTIAPHLTEHAQRWRNFQNTSPQIFKDFIRERPAHMIQHLRSMFNLAEPITWTVDASSFEAGSIRVNTITVTNRLTGVYFPDTPLSVVAVPNSGYAFVGWLELPDEKSPAITINPQQAPKLTALFSKVDVTHHPVRSNSIYYGNHWYFSDQWGWIYSIQAQDPWTYSLFHKWLATGQSAQTTWVYSANSGQWSIAAHSHLPIYFIPSVYSWVWMDTASEWIWFYNTMNWQNHS